MNDDGGQYDTGSHPKTKEPWFGAKRFGYGFGPRTWQGYLVTAILTVFAVAVGTLVKGRMPDILFVIIPVIAVPLIIRSIQSR
ncbi:MAG TPA: hypothetical protein VMC83_26720 [Streptosporangiaceae bacterium]|nr:hypothetical protein [Streptosporangiaceae bacterium]